MNTNAGFVPFYTSISLIPYFCGSNCLAEPVTLCYVVRFYKMLFIEVFVMFDRLMMIYRYFN